MVIVAFAIGSSTNTTKYKISSFLTINVDIKNSLMHETKEDTIYVQTYNKDLAKFEIVVFILINPLLIVI